MSFDFSTISNDLLATTGTPMQLKSPDGYDTFAYQDGDKWGLTTTPESEKAECKPSRLFIIGADSKPFRRRQSEMFKVAQDVKNVGFERAEEEGAKTIAAAIVGWENVIWGGKQLEFTPENVVMFLLKYRPAAEQVDAFMTDRANFFKRA